MTFLTILGVTEILCSFRLVLEEKTGNEIPESSRLEFLEKFLANNFPLSDAEDNTSWPLNRGGIADFFFFENTISNTSKASRAKFMGSDGLFFVAYASLAASRTLATINSLSKLYFRSRGFILVAQTKKVISMNYGSSTSSWKSWRWVRFDLTLTMRDIYINFNQNSLIRLTSSSRITEFKYILPWNIPQIIMKTISISTRMVISYAMKRGISCFEFIGKSMETETTTWWEFPNGRKTIVKQILASEEKNKSKSEQDCGSRSQGSK